MKKMFKIFLSLTLIFSLCLSTFTAYAALGDNPSIPPTAKKIESVNIAPATHTSGSIGSVTVTVNTSNVDNGTVVTAQLISGATPVAGVAPGTGAVSNDTAVISLTIPALLGAGNYKVKVSISEYNLVNDSAAFTVTAGTPGITNVQITPASIVSGSQSVITVRVYTTNVQDGTAAIISLIDSHYNISSAASPTNTIINNNYIYTTLNISPAIQPGIYYIKVHADGVSPDYISSALIVTPSESGGELSSEKQITGFWFEIDGAEVEIDEANKAIRVTVPYGTDITSLAPNITISDFATVSPGNRVAVDFTDPVTYTVTAEDGSEQEYVVTVSIAPPETTPTPTPTPTSTSTPMPPSTTVPMPPETVMPSLTPLPPASGEGIISIEGSVNESTGSIEATITKKDFSEALNDSDVKGMIIDSDAGSIKFNKAAMDKIGEALDSADDSIDVSISISKIDKTDAFKNLSEAEKEKAAALIGQRPIYDFSISVGGTKISNFGSGELTITIPYTLAEDEDPNCIIIYYINDNGTLENISKCAYDPVAKTVTFTINHLSYYAVAYKEVSFTDLPDGHWAESYINFLAARGIMVGYGDKFGPGDNLTRGQFARLLAVIHGADMSKYTRSGFDDVPNTHIFMKEIAWAAENGIIYGDGKGKFNPDAPITREHMCAMIKRFMDKVALKPLPVIDNPTELIDKDQISKGEIYEAVMALNRSGIIVGSNNIFNPKGFTTRAAAARVLTLIIQELIK